MSNANTAGIFAKIAQMFFLITPTAICIFLAVQLRTMSEQSITPDQEQLVCFAADQCAIQVNGIWYQISNVIDMTETIPKEYLPVNDEPLQDNPDVTSEKD